MANNHAIKTPHAAVVIWNYDDRLSKADTNSAGRNKVQQLIISTVSCKEIQTSKSKGNPNGTFQFSLAPTKNWVATITPGSWCAILMTNDDIVEADLRTRADHRKVKMLGKIESVHVSVRAGENGERISSYTVSGVDWGYFFNNNIYLDPKLSEGDKNLANPLVIAFHEAMFSSGEKQLIQSSREMMQTILDITGTKIQAGVDDEAITGRTVNAMYQVEFPIELSKYFSFVSGSKNSPVKSLTINKALTLVTGVLDSQDKYREDLESFGYFNILTMQGTHTFWQVLMEHCNPALNEMVAEIRWEKIVSKTKKGEAEFRPKLTLYNRRKPFSLTTGYLKSPFTLLKYHEIQPVQVMSIDAGTNWRDKYNFIEIKTEIVNPEIFGVLSALGSQKFDRNAFAREGFRPRIEVTKQFPSKTSKKTDEDITQVFNQDAIPIWANVIREWFFDTHRMLNGTMTLTGVDEYIAVGDNIRFNLDLLNPNPNFKKKTVAENKANDTYVLAHVESITHNFRVNDEGARTYTTTIQFVRGIIVSSANKLIDIGTLDKFASGLAPKDDRNQLNTISTSDDSDPDSQKYRGN